jgi:hypothetical protein
VQNFSPKDWTIVLDDGYYKQIERIQKCHKFFHPNFFKTKQPWRQFVGTLKIIHNKVVKRERNRSANASNS